MDSLIYIVGFLTAGLYIVLGADDLIWDLIALFTRNRLEKVPIENLDEKPPKLLAIAIAAWHEDAVIGQVVENILASVQYPGSMYYIFLGVYPNDTETIAVAEKLHKAHPNVIPVINPTPGPTNKADNINSIIRFIKSFENEHGWEFASVTIHDSEDVIHPYEFKMTNYLLDKYDVLQFPVFPLQEMPRIANFFRNLTTGTYADEFAENHYRTMRLRDAAAFVPSAGTGFVISGKVLQSYGIRDVFPENSLTEDYKLSLTFIQEGIRAHYVLEKVERLDQNKRIVWDYISTRSMFPSTFATAVRQKSRWVFGITMQSFTFKDIFTYKNMKFSERCFMYKDMKAKVANFAILPGYCVFIYFAVSLFVTLPVMFPAFTLSWWLCVLLTFMMLERQILRALSIKNVYGWRSMAAACLTPPILPVRLVWGNIINMMATFKAWEQKLSGPKKKQKTPASTRPVWNKTDHEFLDEQILHRYRRTLGDILLEKRYVDAKTLEAALTAATTTGVRVGDILIGDGLLREDQLMESLALVKHMTYVPIEPELIDKRYAQSFSLSLLEKLVAFPLLETSDGFVIAFSNASPENSIEQLEQASGRKIYAAYSTEERIRRALFLMHATDKSSFECEATINLFTAKKISHEQVIIVEACSAKTGLEDEDILTYMGLKTKENRITTEDPINQKEEAPVIA